MFEVSSINKIQRFAEGALDKQTASAVKSRAWVGAIAMAVPLFGLEVIVYAIALWSTYTEICNISGVPFRKHFFKNVFVGLITNIIIAFVCNMLLEFIPLAGWLGAAAFGFCTIYFSGMGFIETLKKFYGKKIKTDINYSEGFKKLN